MSHPVHGAAPEKVGEYKVLKVLGAGSFAQVAVGEHEKTGEKVALKVINTGTWTEKNKQRRTTLLKREIRLCRLLHHPNIIRLLGTMQDGNNIVLLMEYQSGGDLEHYAYAQKHGYVAEAKARDFFRQIISGVDYLHKNYMTHRDIKPANIILDKAHTTPKLIDFGFTNIFDEKEKMQSFLGSPHFAAPELLTGTKYKGPAVDVWSLGVTLYAVLTGKLPFQATTMEQLMELIVRANFTFPSHVPESAQALIRRMLTVDMDDRASMEEVRNNAWMCDGYGMPPPDLSIPRNQPIDDIDPQAFKALVSYGFDDQEEVTRQLQSPENSTIKSVYCLLLETRAREQQAKYIQEAKDLQAQHQQEQAHQEPAAKRQSSGGLSLPNAVKELLSPITRRRSSSKKKKDGDKSDKSDNDDASEKETDNSEKQ